MELANGKYHSLTYQIDDDGNGKLRQDCSVYIHRFGHFNGSHWDGALRGLEEAMNGRPVLSEDIPVSTTAITDAEPDKLT